MYSLHQDPPKHSAAEPQPKLGLSRAKTQRSQRSENNGEKFSKIIHFFPPNLACFAPWRESIPHVRVFRIAAEFTAPSPPSTACPAYPLPRLAQLAQSAIARGLNVRERQACMLSKFCLVRKRGVEPLRVLPHRILNPARLPVPPLSPGAISTSYHYPFSFSRSNLCQVVP